jgi:ribosomal protein S18 acetylase RimI-like enzyme
MTTTEHLLELFTRYQRQAELDLLAERAEEHGALRFTRHDLRWGFVTYSRLSASNADQAIAAHLDYYRSLGYAFEWKYYSYDTPDDLPERLLAAGFQQQEREALMLLDLEHAPAILTAPPAVDVRRLPTLEAIADADAVHEAVWEDAGAVSLRVQQAWSVDPQSVSVYAAYVDGIPACYGRIEFSPVGNPFASIWGGATLPQYRKRGLYTGLVAARIQEAQQRGYRYIVIDADPQTSMPILQKLGFITIAYTTGFEWESLLDDQAGA